MTSTPATLWLRLAAAIYDLFPLIGLWMLTAALALLVAQGSVDPAHPTLAWRFGLRGILLTHELFKSWSKPQSVVRR